jgi:hypothetical protein
MILCASLEPPANLSTIGIGARKAGDRVLKLGGKVKKQAQLVKPRKRQIQPENKMAPAALIITLW